MSQFDQLLNAISCAPCLPGARCRGRHHLFDGGPLGEDPRVRQARHEQALALCAGCPSLEPCQTWHDSLPKRQRPPGVVAGRVNCANGRPAARRAEATNLPAAEPIGRPRNPKGNTTP